MRARALVDYRLGGESADGTRSRPEEREWTRTSRPPERQKEEASINVSVLSGQLSASLASDSGASIPPRNQGVHQIRHASDPQQPSTRRPSLAERWRI
jgi:hypothetical protein